MGHAVSGIPCKPLFITLALSLGGLSLIQWFDRRQAVAYLSALRTRLEYVEAKQSDMAYEYRCDQCGGSLKTDFHIGRYRCGGCRQPMRFVGVTVHDPTTMRGYNDHKRPAQPAPAVDTPPAGWDHRKWMVYRVSELQRQASEIKSELGI